MPMLYYDTVNMGDLVARCPILESPFKPTFWMAGGHRQTIITTMLRWPMDVNFQRYFPIKLIHYLL